MKEFADKRASDPQFDATIVGALEQLVKDLKSGKIVMEVVPASDEYPFLIYFDSALSFDAVVPEPHIYKDYVCCANWLEIWQRQDGTNEDGEDQGTRGWFLFCAMQGGSAVVA